MKGCNSGIKKGDLEMSDFQTLKLCNLRLQYLFVYTGEFVFVCIYGYIYRGADKSLVRPGRKRANVSVGMV